MVSRGLDRPEPQNRLAFGELAARFGTPLYVHDAEAIRRRIREMRDAVPWPSVRIFYSVKAHANVAILSLMRAMGVGVDACSAGDLAWAEAASVSGHDITFTAVSMTADDAEAIKRSGAFFVADSVRQLERLAASGRRGEVGLRVRTGLTAGFHQLVQSDAPSSKFGLTPAEVGPAVQAAADLGFQVVGLHAHVGSDMLTAEPHLEVLDRLLALTREHVPAATMVDIGGGWGTPFLPPDAGGSYPPPTPEERYPLAAFGSKAAARLAAFEARTGRHLELRLEPGAFLMMEAGYLVAAVTEVKPAVEDGDRPRPVVVLDTSYSHLRSAVLHQTFHELWVEGPAASRPVVRQDVVGDLMQAGDRLAVDRALPRLEEGDVVAFARAGAYKACLAPTFNGRPRPAEVLVDGPEARLVRRRETLEDLLRAEAAGQDEGPAR